MEQKKKINKKFVAIISVIVAIGVVYGTYKFIHSLSHEDTDDAHVEENMSPIIPRVAGYVQKVYVTDNHRVQKGDTLFVIDNSDYLVNIEQAKANLLAAQNALLVAQASTGSSEANSATASAQVKTATETIKSAEIKLWRAENDFNRYENLYKNHSITAQQYEQALAAKQEAENHLQVLKSQKLASSSKKNAAISQADISEKQVAVAEANVKSAEAVLNAAKLNLGYTVVTAPISGQLSTVKIQKGQFVQPGQSLFYLINTSVKWVVANFKETQLAKMKIGQKVGIKVDAYPDEEFEGIVATFSPATGSKFSLLPPDNATGNFVKTIQRLPVKIEFTANNNKDALAKLRSGMNVTTDVHLK